MRPYTLSKKLLALVTLQFSLFQTSLFKERRDGAELVGLTGVEPVTSSLSGTRSNQLSYKPNVIGGGSRIRTGDMLLAKQPLYQLSYTPVGAPSFRKGGGTLGVDRPVSCLNFATEVAAP